MEKLKLIDVQVKDLKPWVDNPRKNDDAAKKLAALINDNGYRVPIIIDQNNVIRAGHTRLKALQQNGLKDTDKIQVIQTDFENESAAIAFAIADNKSNEWSLWDDEKLLGILQNVEDIKSTGFDEKGIKKLMSSVEKMQNNQKASEDDFNLSVDRRCMEGDVWVLGDHRLICGDCLDKNTLKRLIGNKRMDLLLTDPPYNVDYSGKNELLNKLDKGNRVQRPIKNDKIKDFKRFLMDVFKNISVFMNDKNCCYVFMSSAELHNLRLAFEEAGFTWSDYLVWVKNNHVLGRKDYNLMHEFVMYGWLGTHKFYGGFSTTILDFNRPQKSDLHPTMKPVELLGKLVTDGSLQGMNVLDCFGGSGSTLIACEQTERKCFVSEIEEVYCDVIISRWEQLTGRVAIKEE